MKSEAEASYMAGFVDGEGCITVGTGLQLCLIIGTTNKAVMMSLKDIWGGGSLHKRQDKRTWCKPVFYLVWGINDTLRILTEIQPYLKVKRKHCAVALQFQGTLREIGRAHV